MQWIVSLITSTLIIAFLLQKFSSKISIGYKE